MAGLELLSEQGYRVDGRRASELRQIRARMGVFAQADGSTYLEQGNTKALAVVYGPHEARGFRGKAPPDQALVNCQFSMATFSTGERKRRPHGCTRTTWSAWPRPPARPAGTSTPCWTGWCTSTCAKERLSRGTEAEGLPWTAARPAASPRAASDHPGLCMPVSNTRLQINVWNEENFLSLGKDDKVTPGSGCPRRRARASPAPFIRDLAQYKMQNKNIEHFMRYQITREKTGMP
ncbi:uncharacterized protein M6D78_007824 [Vipera latastei]